MGSEHLVNAVEEIFSESASVGRKWAEEVRFKKEGKGANEGEGRRTLLRKPGRSLFPPEFLLPIPTKINQFL